MLKSVKYVGTLLYLGERSVTGEAKHYTQIKMKFRIKKKATNYTWENDQLQVRQNITHK